MFALNNQSTKLKKFYCYLFKSISSENQSEKCLKRLLQFPKFKKITLFVITSLTLYNKLIIKPIKK